MTEVCPICLEPLTNQVSLYCKHLYCDRPKNCVLSNACQEGKATKCSVCRVISQRKCAYFLNNFALPEGRKLQYLLDLKTNEKCSKEGHKEELLEFICTSHPCDNCQLCSVCVEEDHSGDNHIVETISDSVATNREIMSQIVDKSDSYINFTLKWVKINQSIQNRLLQKMEKLQQYYKDSTTVEHINHLNLKVNELACEIESASKPLDKNYNFKLVIDEEKCTAGIEWSALNVLPWADWKSVVSPMFKLGDFNWRVSVTCDTHESGPGIGVNIHCSHPTLAEWSVKAAYDIEVINQISPVLSKHRSSEDNVFHSCDLSCGVFDGNAMEEDGCGESCLVPKADLLDETKGWVYEEKLKLRIILKIIQSTLPVP